MNKKVFGETITALRKKNRLTQSALAEKLHVSDKAISKWETGQGYPEITLLPEIAKTLGVTVDYLMNGERRGITIAGNILTDVVKNIDCYPRVGMLSNITAICRSVGGCVPNTGIDLAKIDKTLPISAIGCIGDDEYGRYIISQLHQFNIDTSRVVVSASANTSFSDVMSLSTGERTFFHARGANAEFHPSQIDLSSLNCQLLHIGYLLLLDGFDAKDAAWGTVMAGFLHDVQKRGIKTSIDMVSDSSRPYAPIVLPALKYCDYVIINEIECAAVWDVPPRKEDGSLNLPVLREAMERMMECGVAEKVIVHAKEAGLCLSKNGEFTAVPSLMLPKAMIKGSVGAGDAFCAGALYSIYNRASDREMLKFASAAAACSLFAENAVDGMRGKDEILRLMEAYPRRSLEGLGQD